MAKDDILRRPNQRIIIGVFKNFEEIRMKKNFLLVMITALGLALTGCIGIQGGSEQGQSEPTLGQQLI